MSFVCDVLRCRCSDEFSCESQQFFVGVLTNICDDFCFCVCWVGVPGVFKCARDSDLADCLEFVCVADDVADEGVVWRQEFVVIQWFACEDCFVFRAV